MLSIERAKKILSDSTLTDEQIEEIRDGFYSLVEDVIFPAWLEDQKKKKAALPPHEAKTEIIKS